MRVLLLADDCNPNWPSLPVVGYKACRAIGDQVEAVVVTHVRNRAAIAETGMGRCRVEYVDNEYLAAPLYRLSRLLRGGDAVGWTTNVALAYPSYLAFEYEVWKRYRVDLSRGKFDLIHRVTPMSPTIPSPLAEWSEVPFVIGPLNGGLRWPNGFANELVREREWLVPLRKACRSLPYHRATYRKAAAILAAFPHTLDDLPPNSRPRIIPFPEVGIDPELFFGSPRQATEGPVNFVFVGRLVPYKCPDVAVLAFARSPALQRHRLTIVGDGPERPRLEALVRENRLNACVTFLGSCPQTAVGGVMRRADVFVFPSIRELGAGVVVEAMASGLACVVVDYGAPGDLIAPDRGVKVPLGTKRDLIDRFAESMTSLAADRERTARLGSSARDYALTHFTWVEKARKTLEVYRWALHQRTVAPSFYN
jgi:glycosyltransferase involved in cell wall biosynthesis